MKGREDKRQDLPPGREERAQKHPGPDPVHPEASKPVAGKSPEELRRQQERRIAEERAGDAR
ncbi:hypothetical protein [Streptomyces sp. NPDC047718]|uniref:hypothetical protein n=1 Tax=Streptomyces sp. NPDC047718 TaxID=3155479 RepID=UPI0033FA3860